MNYQNVVSMNIELKYVTCRYNSLNSTATCWLCFMVSITTYEFVGEKLMVVKYDIFCFGDVLL